VTCESRREAHRTAERSAFVGERGCLPRPARAGWPWTEHWQPMAETMPDGRPWPLVSVVTPSYNQAGFIEATIRSVLLQGYPALEYIVIDGGSADGSVEIIRKYADRLTYWVSEPDRGQTDALNKGFARGRGEIMAWLNSDDLYMPGAIRRAVETLVANPRVGLVYGKATIVDADGGFLRPAWARPFRRVDVLRGEWAVIQQPAAFWRRSTWERVGPLDARLHYCMDYDFWMSISERFDAIHVPDVWAQFREHEASKTVTGLKPFQEEAILVRRRHHQRRRLLRLAVEHPRIYLRPTILVFLAARMLPRSWMRRINRLRGLPPVPE
jgi:glycosyltransferase involved in cell wall biosynthesis